MMEPSEARTASDSGPSRPTMVGRVARVRSMVRAARRETSGGYMAPDRLRVWRCGAGMDCASVPPDAGGSGSPCSVAPDGWWSDTVAASPPWPLDPLGGRGVGVTAPPASCSGSAWGAASSLPSDRNPRQHTARPRWWALARACSTKAGAETPGNTWRLSLGAFPRRLVQRRPGLPRRCPAPAGFVQRRPGPKPPATLQPALALVRGATPRRNLPCSDPAGTRRCGAARPNRRPQDRRGTLSSCRRFVESRRDSGCSGPRRMRGCSSRRSSGTTTAGRGEYMPREDPALPPIRRSFHRSRPCSRESAPNPDSYSARAFERRASRQDCARPLHGRRRSG